MREILERLLRGEITIDEAERQLRVLAIERVEHFARLDVSREARRGVPEVVFGMGKRAEDIVEIVKRIIDRCGRAIVSKVSEEHVEVLDLLAKDEDFIFDYNKIARMIVIRRRDFNIKKTGGIIGVITAGTSDIPVAEEARITAEQMGCEVLTAYDVGVAGLHRLFPPLKHMIESEVQTIVVTAGMEGALPSVVAGLVGVPVIGVPTSLGYGLGSGGVGALTSMLQSCTLGLSVVNIDNGVGAGALAALIANQVVKHQPMKG